MALQGSSLRIYKRVEYIKQNLRLVSVARDNIGHVLHFGSFDYILIDGETIF